jgi:hypothetical protein
MLGWLGTLHRWVVGGEAWAAAYSWVSEHIPKFWGWIKGHWATAVAMISSLGLGTWFASGITAINSLGWGIWPFVGLLFALGLALLFYVIALTIGRFKQLSAPRDTSIERRTSSDLVPIVDEQAEHDLKVFVTDHIIRTGVAQKRLQEAIIDLICNNNETVAWLASQAILSNYQVDPFGQPFQELWKAFGSSPARKVPLDEMMDDILSIDKNYQAFCDQADRLAESSGIDYRTHETLAPLWGDWRQKHNDLVRAYRAIKRDLRFPKLVRPGIHGLWDRDITDATAADSVPDMPVREALYWAVGVTDPSALAPALHHVSIEAWKAAASAIRTAAYNGRVRVWGRRKLPDAEHAYSGIEEKIDLEHWRVARLNLLSCSAPLDGSVCRSEPESDSQAVLPVIYGHLRVNRREIKRLWPKPGRP